MTSSSHSTDLAFSLVDDDDFTDLFTNECFTSLYNNISFDLLRVLDEKYNIELDVNNSYVISKCHDIPKSNYICMDSFCLQNNDPNIITIFNMNIRSVPTNLQVFNDSVVASHGVKLDIIGLTETRLDSDIMNLYNLPGYNMFSQNRSRYGGGVAIYTSDEYLSTPVCEFSLTEPSIECLGIVYH